MSYERKKEGGCSQNYRFFIDWFSCDTTLQVIANRVLEILQVMDQKTPRDLS
jgi:hypothetical protein